MHGEASLKSGLVFFAGGLGSQLGQQILHISTKSVAGLPIVCTVGTVVVSSVAAGRVSSGQSFKNKKLTNEDLYAALSGILVFTVLGGRWRAYTPSHLAAVGAFGREFVSASKLYASTKAKQTITEIGKRYGCHTCGKRFHFYVADHQPPLRLARKQFLFFPGRTKFKFFPQCQACSSAQAATLKAWPRSFASPIRSHFFIFRPHHATGFFLPPLTDLFSLLLPRPPSSF